MRFAWCVLAGSLAWAQTPDAAEIVRTSVHRDLLNFERLKNYTYNERDETRYFDKKGKITKTEIEDYEILILGGRAYAKKTGRDGKPLPEKEALKEQQKMDQELARRERESASDKAKLEKERQQTRKFLSEVPDAFNFKVEGEDTISGKPAWVIAAEPKPGYKPKDRRAKIITKMRGKIWIDQNDYQWVKIDADVIETMSFGFRLVQIDPGGRVEFEQTRINDEIWLPAAAHIRASARVAFIKRIRTEADIVFSGYKKFQADSNLVAEPK
jgi:hypothetical protein